MDYYTKEDFIDEIDVESERFDRIPSDEVIQETIKNIEDRNINVHLFENEENTLEFLKSKIPQDNTVNIGHSTTMEEIGFIEYLESGDHPWNYWANKIRNTDDKKKRLKLRREGMTVEMFLDSPNAISRSGEIIGVNAGGSGVGAWPYSASNLMLISGVNKIVPSFEEAIQRCKKFALPLEDMRARKEYGKGSIVGKMVSYEYETVDNRTDLVLIKDQLGF